MTDVREQLREQMESRGIPQSGVAASLGISGSSLSQWLAGNYRGDNSKVSAKVAAWLKRQAEKQGRPQGLPFCETSISKRIHEVARLCHIDGDLGVVIGDAGLGKTIAVKEYARHEADCLLIEADHGYSAKTLFQEILRRLGIDDSGKAIHPMLMAAVEKLKGSGRLVIVDEAEHLPYRALELLRRLHDHAGVGMLLVGMPQLYTNLKGQRVDYAQLYSRVGVFTHLKPLTKHDVARLVEAVHPDANGLTAVYADACGGNARRLSKLIARASRVAQVNGRPVDREIIESATKLLIA